MMFHDVLCCAEFPGEKWLDPTAKGSKGVFQPVNVSDSPVIRGHSHHWNPLDTTNKASNKHQAPEFHWGFWRTNMIMISHIVYNQRYTHTYIHILIYNISILEVCFGHCGDTSINYMISRSLRRSSLHPHGEPSSADFEGLSQSVMLCYYCYFHSFSPISRIFCLLEYIYII
jgi:hypothetical protein